MSVPRSFLGAVVLLALFCLGCTTQAETDFKVSRCGAEPLVSAEEVAYAARFDANALFMCLKARDEVLLRRPRSLGTVQ